MKKSFRKIFVLSFLSIFVWSAIFCCCNMGIAQANPCHKAAQVKTVKCGVHGSSATGSCSCKAGFVTDPSKSSVKVKSSLEKNDIALIALETEGHSFVNQQFVSSESPPGLEESTQPLYLLNRVLRL